MASSYTYALVHDNSITVNLTRYPYRDTISLVVDEARVGRYSGLDALTERDRRNMTPQAFARNVRAQARKYADPYPSDNSHIEAFRTFERAYGNLGGRLWLSREAMRPSLLEHEQPTEAERRPRPADPITEPTLFIGQSITKMTRAFGVEGNADSSALIRALVDATRNRHPDGDAEHAPESYDVEIVRSGFDYRDTVELPILASRGGRGTAVYFDGLELASEKLQLNALFVAQLFVEYFITSKLDARGRDTVDIESALAPLRGELDGSLYTRSAYANSGFVNASLGVLVNFHFPLVVKSDALPEQSDETFYGVDLSATDLDDPRSLTRSLERVARNLQPSANALGEALERYDRAEREFVRQPTEAARREKYAAANEVARVKIDGKLAQPLAERIREVVQAYERENRAYAQSIRNVLAKRTALTEAQQSLEQAQLELEAADAAVDELMAREEHSNDEELARRTELAQAHDRVSATGQAVDSATYLLAASENQRRLAELDRSSEGEHMKLFVRDELLSANAQRQLVADAERHNLDNYPAITDQRYNALVGLASALLVAAELRRMSFPRIVSQAERYPNMVREFEHRRMAEANECANEIDRVASALPIGELSRLRAFTDGPTAIFLDTPGGAQLNELDIVEFFNSFEPWFERLAREWQLQ